MNRPQRAAHLLIWALLLAAFVVGTALFIVLVDRRIAAVGGA